MVPRPTTFDASRYLRPDVAPVLSENALTVLKKRYLGRSETPEELFWRVALHVARAEEDVQAWADRFYRSMAALEFVPNSPALMNAGRRLGQLFACFVLPVADAIASPSDEGIFDTIRSTAVIHQSGGGTGFSFSRLRPKGALVESTMGRASGPLSFMRVFNAATEAIHQGGFRRGANMGILRVDHPDIVDFINLKSDPAEMTNFNLSVGLTDEFLRAVSEDRKHFVVEPHTGRKIPLGDWTARALFDLIVKRAWESGEPGIVFLDRINAFNPTPQLGEMEATNPCVPGDTWVMTEEGPRQVTDLLDRAAVLLLDGERAPSETGFFRTGVKPLVRVVTREGYAFRATPDHLVRRIERMTRHVRDTEWVAAGRLAPGDRIALNDHRDVVGWPGKGSREEGYLLGLLTGDGTLKGAGGVVIVRGEGEGPDAVRAAAERAARTLLLPGRFETAERGETLLRLPSLPGLADRERTSSSFHAGFLRGFFDACGTVTANPARGVSVRLTHQDGENLAAAQRMLLRIGVVSTLQGLELAIGGENLPRFRDVVGFEHLDKRLKLEGALASSNRELNRERFVATVESVTPGGQETVYDVKVPGANAFDGNGVHLHNCGEQPLLPFEACNLGSINLAKFVEPGPTSPESRLHWSRLGEAVKLGVRFLDDVIDVNSYPKPQIEGIVRGNRKVGLGLMGWADALYLLGVRYDSDEALALGRALMKFVKEEAWKASIDLARERGAFPNFEGSLFTTAKDHPYFADAWREESKRLGRPAPMRNATVTTIAPTGTISIIAGASGGIEPLFSLAFTRQILDGEKLQEVHPYFKEVATREGFYRSEIVERLIREGTAEKVAEIPERWRDVFATAHDVSPEAHLRMQAAFQDSCDNAVSKTVNFPESAQPGDIRRVYDLAVELGVKGVTVYRDGSRRHQPMALEKREPGAKRPVPETAEGRRYRMPTNLGNAYITITEDEAGPREIFTNIGKCGSDISALSEAICRVVSTALGHGVPMEELARQLLNITSQPVPSDGGWVKSLPDAIGQAMMRHLKSKSGAAGEVTGGLCPDCGAPLRYEEGCAGGKCVCGYSRC